MRDSLSAGRQGVLDGPAVLLAGVQRRLLPRAVRRLLVRGAVWRLLLHRAERDLLRGALLALQRLGRQLQLLNGTLLPFRELTLVARAADVPVAAGGNTRYCLAMNLRGLVVGAASLLCSCGDSGAQTGFADAGLQAEAGTGLDGSGQPEVGAGADASADGPVWPEASADVASVDAASVDAASADATGPAVCGDKTCGPAEDCETCSQDCGPCNPDIYEPFEHVAPALSERSASELAQSNGCFSRGFGQFHERAMCLATTRPVTDLVSETSPSRARAGKSSMRFVLKPTPLEDWPSGEATHRNELAPDGAWEYFPAVGEERWYGFSVLFPEDFVFAPPAIASTNRFIIAQWQHGTAGSPAVSFEVLGDKLQVVLNGGTAPDGIHEVGRGDVATITRGEWLDFMLRVVWHKTQGAVVVWSQGTAVFEQLALQTVYDNKDNGGQMKVGIYYWRWKNQSDVKAALDAGIVDREVFFDELREYHGN
jgi:hypothetical protein